MTALQLGSHLLYCAAMTSRALPGMVPRWRSGWILVRSINPALAERLALAAILLTAAYLRLAHLDQAQFRNDDIGLWELTRHLAQDPELLARGIASSFGIANGPMQAYLLLPAVPFRSPIAPYLIVAGLNCAAVGLLWAFARVSFGPTVAVLAAGLFAVNPWAVIFSRRLWGDDLMAPFVVLLVGSLCSLARHGRRRDHIWPFVWFGVVAQVYVPALAHLVTLLIGLALAHRRLRRPWLLAGSLIGLGLLAPYLRDEVLPHLDTLGRLTGADGSTPGWDASGLAYVFHLVSSEGYQAFAHHLGAELDTATGWPRWLSAVVQGFLGLGLVAMIGVGVRRLRPAGRAGFCPAAAAPYLLPVVVVLLPALLLVWHGSKMLVQVYYLLIGYPFHFLLVAQGVVTLPRAAGYLTDRLRLTGIDRRIVLRAVTVAVIAVVGLQAGLHLWLAGRFFAGLDRYWPNDDYGLPLAMTRRLGDDLLAEGGPATRLMVVGSEERDVVLARALALDYPRSTGVNAQHGLIVPADPAKPTAYLVELTTSTPASRFFADRFRPKRTYTLPGTPITHGVFRPDPDQLRAAVRAVTPDPGAATFGGLLSLEATGVAPDVPVDGAPFFQALLRVTSTLPWDQTPTVSLRLEDTLGQVHEAKNVPLGVIGRLEPDDSFLVWFGTRADKLPAGPLRTALGLYLVESGGARVIPAELPGEPASSAVRSGWTYQSPPGVPPAAVSLAYQFGTAIRLAGFDWDVSDPGDGTRRVTVTLHWDAAARPDRDYTVFVHLLGPDGRVLGQHDGPPAGGRWPTGLWRPGESVLDQHTIELPAGQPDPAAVRIGLYDPRTQDRLGGPAALAEAPVPVRR